VYQTVAVDSNMLTYLHDATSLPFDPDTDPDRELARQKVALVRTLFYWDGTLRLVPTVMAEYQRIRQSARRDSHDVFAMVVFDEIGDVDPQKVELLAHHYQQYHPGSADCRIVAEAEVSGTSILLTYDDDLHQRLRSRVHSVRLMNAAQFWGELQLPPGARPHLLPKRGNPLLEKTWWRW